MLSTPSRRSRSGCSASASSSSVSAPPMTPTAESTLVLPPGFSTPKSSKRRRDREEDSGLNLLSAPLSPGSLLSPSPSSISKRRLKALSRTVPPQFKMCLPTSARKRLPSPAKPNVEGIQRSSFYGGAPSPANSSKVDKVLKERSLNSSSNSLNSSKATENDDDDDEDDTSKEEEESENVKGEPEKKKIKLDPDSGKKRNTPTPVNKGIRKLKKTKRRASTGSFGFGGKGVSHGIRKPKRKASPPMKKTKVPLLKPVQPKFTTTLQPEREGKLSPSVNYVVKNGQYHFVKRRRSSPRKNLSPAKASSPFTPCHVRKTPKLFTPSSNGDYLLPDVNSPSRTPRSSKTNFIPSPVKFDKEDAAEEEEEDHQQSLVQNVSGILEDMDEDDREIAFRTPTKNPPRSQYSAYVADEEELSEVAMKAAMEIADLDGGVGMDDLQPLVYDDTSNDGSSPLKLVLRSSPRKAPSSPIKESTTASPRKSPKKVMSPTKVTTPLKGASRQITAATKITTPKKTPSKANSLKKTPSKANSPEKTPSKKQTPVKRTPLKNVADRTPMKNETPLASPAKTATPEPSSAVPKLTRRSSSRLGSEASSRSSTPAKGTFPIFGKTTAKTGLEEGKANNNPTATTRSSKRSLGKSSADQMILDAGQKKIGCYPCEVCGFLYTRGDSEAEKVHEKFHKQYLGVVAFSGWKSERVIKEDHETRILLIKPTDPKRHWEKAESVLKVVDDSLGVNFGVRAQMRSEFYLTIKDKRVVGMLLAESLAPTDKVSRSFVKNNVRVLSDLNPKTSPVDFKSLIGVSRIWVHSDYQRSGIASRMAEALRERFRFPFKADKSQLAFSHTTEMGSAFAESYVGREEFLVYRAA